jgi:3-oxoacyl-[acyl-carrier protein] reductase
VQPPSSLISIGSWCFRYHSAVKKRANNMSLNPSFGVPAEYFYALGAGLPMSVTPEKRFQLATSQSEPELVALLAEAKRFRLTDSSASQDLPAPASLTGIELRKRVAAVARRALGDAATIVTADVRTGSMPRAGSILLFDVLHMVPFDEQASLLQRLIDVLEPSGILLLREVDAAAGWRFTLVRVGNRLQAAVAGRWRQSLCFRSLDDWRRLLGDLGLQATVVGTGQEGPLANVLIVARRGHLLKTLQDEIEASGSARPHALALDLADRGAAARVRDEAIARLGHVDILVNNAGGSRPTAVDAPDDVWDESLAINFTAVRKLTQALVPGMIERRWGRILSVTGTSEPAGTNAAGPAKAAVHAWAKGLSRDVGRHGITVNCLAPGRIHSEQIDQRLHPTPENQAQFARQIPLGYFGDPSDMAYLVAFLCSNRARYITGERIHVDGGLRRAI